MSRKTEGILKGIAVGMAVGAVAYIMTADSMKKTRKRCRKNVTRALNATRDMIDEVGYMIR